MPPRTVLLVLFACELVRLTGRAQVWMLLLRPLSRITVLVVVNCLDGEELERTVLPPWPVVLVLFPMHCCAFPARCSPYSICQKLLAVTAVSVCGNPGKKLYHTA